MKQVIYLTADQYGIKKMTKSIPAVARHEIAVKLEIEIPGSAFRPPTLSRKIVVDDWRQGTELGDVELRQQFITEDEAEIIRQRRRDKMAQVLSQAGYTVEPPPQAPAEEST